MTDDALTSRVDALASAVAEREAAVADRNHIIGWLITNAAAKRLGIPHPLGPLDPRLEEIVTQLQVSMREDWDDWRWR